MGCNKLLVLARYFLSGPTDRNTFHLRLLADIKEDAIFYTQHRSGLIQKKGLGLFHLYYGQGVGKTTRAIGLAIRAAGEGLRVDFVQFLKSGTSAEVNIFKQIENIHYWCAGRHPFIMPRGTQPVHHNHAEKGYQFALDAIENGSQVLICDEILDTLLFELLKPDQLIDLVDRCRSHVEIVMTGRNAPPTLIDAADYVTELIQVKHPYYKGARARRGIEY
jgi:cob(I)alamin adenosyltransferase